jgi:hypothetical protein
VALQRSSGWEDGRGPRVYLKTGEHIFRKGDLPAALGRAAMVHARTHPPPIDRRPRGMLAHLL